MKGQSLFVFSGLYGKIPFFLCCPARIPTLTVDIPTQRVDQLEIPGPLGKQC